MQNLIRVLEHNKSAVKTYVFTTGGTVTELGRFKSGNKNIKIIRLGRCGENINPFKRVWSYLIFYLGTLSYLIIKKPQRVLYYETISSFPAWLYRVFNKRAELFIHYHEYTSRSEYESGMKLTKIFHRLEKRLYPNAKWVSHTNENRMELFEHDILPVKIGNKYILPNYPPKSWRQEAKRENEIPVKIVYVGALSLDTMFTREFTEWVNSQNGKVTWYIYSYNITKDAKGFLQAMNSPHIILAEAVNYDELPRILKQYDVGIILYKGHIANYIYNAPNKLFEYLACGLDVWFPGIMQGIYPYRTINSFPKVIEVDFKNMDDFKLQNALNKEGLKLRHIGYFCEDAFFRLSAAICN